MEALHCSESPLLYNSKCFVHKVCVVLPCAIVLWMDYTLTDLCLICWQVTGTS